MQIDGSKYPYITMLDPPVPVSWHNKFFAQQAASSQGIRVNGRGEFFDINPY